MADLSNWYLDVIKDRLYVSAADSFDRRAAQTVLHALLQVCDTWSASHVALCVEEDPLHHFMMTCRHEFTALQQVKQEEMVSKYFDHQVHTGIAVDTMKHIVRYRTSLKVSQFGGGNSIGDAACHGAHSGRGHIALWHLLITQDINRIGAVDSGPVKRSLRLTCRHFCRECCLLLRPSCPIWRRMPGTALRGRCPQHLCSRRAGLAHPSSGRPCPEAEQKAFRALKLIR